MIERGLGVGLSPRVGELVNRFFSVVTCSLTLSTSSGDCNWSTTLSAVRLLLLRYDDDDRAGSIQAE